MVRSRSQKWMKELIHATARPELDWIVLSLYSISRYVDGWIEVSCTNNPFIQVCTCLLRLFVDQSWRLDSSVDISSSVFRYFDGWIEVTIHPRCACLLCLSFFGYFWLDRTSWLVLDLSKPYSSGMTFILSFLFLVHPKSRCMGHAPLHLSTRHLHACRYFYHPTVLL